MNRRVFLRGTAAALGIHLMPRRAFAQQVPADDGRMEWERVTMPAGYLVKPRPRAGAGLFEGPERYASVLLIHEKRGVDAYVENAARRVVLESFMVFAPEARSIDELHAAALWLKKHPRSTGRVAVLGLGGGATAKALAARLGKDLNAVASFEGDPPVEPDEAWQRTMLQFITSLT